MFNGIGLWAKLGGGLALLVALGLVVTGIYRAGLHAGRAERDAAVAEVRGACLEQQRAYAQSSADAYGRELALARDRALAAQAAEQRAEQRISAARSALEAKLKEIRHARNRVPVAVCFPDDLRLRIDQAGAALADRLAADPERAAGTAAVVSDPLPATAAGGRATGSGNLDRRNRGGLWGLRIPSEGVRDRTAPPRL